jgi:hypothetical protein
MKNTKKKQNAISVLPVVALMPIIYTYIVFCNSLLFFQFQTYGLFDIFMFIIAVNDCLLQSSEIWGNIHPWQFDGPWKVCFTSCQRSV